MKPSAKQRASRYIVTFRLFWFYVDLGVDQNYGPLWGLYYSIFLIVQGTKRGPIILINPHFCRKEKLHQDHTDSRGFGVAFRLVHPEELHAKGRGAQEFQRFPAGNPETPMPLN